MSSSGASSESYVLATGAAAVRRLHVLHDVYSPAGRRILLQDCTAARDNLRARACCRPRWRADRGAFSSTSNGSNNRA